MSLWQPPANDNRNRPSGRPVWVFTALGIAVLVYWAGITQTGLPKEGKVTEAIAADGGRLSSPQASSVPHDLPTRGVDIDSTSTDQTMVLGETREVQAGQERILSGHETVYVEEGQATGTEMTQEMALRPAVSRIETEGAAGVVYRGGREYRFVQEMQLIATGYTAGRESNPVGSGYTYSGMKAVRGVVAVDPRVIPLYTRLYIEEYGLAIAADIGGAIKGDKIDLCFNTIEEAIQWGVRSVKVYLLAD